jgi:hypothetical protein
MNERYRKRLRLARLVEKIDPGEFYDELQRIQAEHGLPPLTEAVVDAVKAVVLKPISRDLKAGRKVVRPEKRRR